MKLYATITSERASKGQGGNKYLVINIMAGNADNPVRIAEIECHYNLGEVLLKFNPSGCYDRQEYLYKGNGDYMLKRKR